MSRLRLILLSLCGFLLPVGLAFLLAPFVFEDSYNKADDYARARLDGDELGVTQHALLPGSIDPDASFVVVPTAPELDPLEQQTFVVSFLVRFNRFPEQGKRNKILFKYAAAVKPYPGWAIAWRNVSTSLRPEVYWQDEEGVGGWFSFAEVPLRLETWYSVTLFAKPGDFLSLYVGEYLETPVFTPIEQRMEVATGERGRDIAEVRYVGGYAMTNLGAKSQTTLGTARTEDSLHIRAGDSAAGDISVDVSEVIVGHTERKVKSINATKRLLAAGSDSVLKYLGQDGLSLWLDSEGKDRSSFKRVVSSSS